MNFPYNMPKAGIPSKTPRRKPGTGILGSYYKEIGRLKMPKDKGNGNGSQCAYGPTYAMFQEVFAQHESSMRAMICDLHCQHQLQSRQAVHQAVNQALREVHHAVNQAVNEALREGFSKFANGLDENGKLIDASGAVRAASATGPIPPRLKEEVGVLNAILPANEEVAEGPKPMGQGGTLQVRRPGSISRKSGGAFAVGHTQSKTADLAAENLERQQHDFKQARPTNLNQGAQQASHRLSKASDVVPLNGELVYVESFVARLVSSSRFDALMSFVIILSSVILFVQTDWTARNPKADTPVFFQHLELCFTLIFAFELGVRLKAFGRTFFTGPDRGWHFLDFLVVSTALIELIAAPIFLQNMVVLRLLRILRIVRVTRILRALKVFTNLRMMVMGIVGCGDSLFWAVVLLMTIIFVFSACFTQVVSGTLADGANIFTAEEVDSLNMNYGTLFRTVYSLFKSVAGGISWGEVCDPLIVISPVLAMVFCFFIIFVSFAVLNIVTGIFVENSIKSMDHDRENKIIEFADQMETVTADAKSVFTSLDEDNSGWVDWEEFLCNVHDEKLQSYFQKLGLEIFDEKVASQLFTQLDFDQSGRIMVDEFIDGLGRLKGPARSVDMARVLHNQRCHIEVMMSLAGDVAAMAGDVAAMCSSFEEMVRTDKAPQNID